MLSERNLIIYMPYEQKGSHANEYIMSMMNILKREYKVAGEFAEPSDVLSMVKTKAVFLNWVEEKLDGRMKAQLCLYRLFGAKIIWVFHNKFPHDADLGDRRVAVNMKWLADHADHIMLHSEHSRKYIPNPKRNMRKAFLVPHIVYERRDAQARMEEFRVKYGITETDFVFLMFGMIRSYKHYEDGIRAFRKLGICGTKLILAGNCVDVEYAKRLKDLCSEDSNIILELRYIPETTLDAIIGLSDVVMIPYVNGSSMNSGVMMQAFSNARTVIASDICMARDFASLGFFYGYRKSLEGVMRRAYKNGKDGNRKKGERAYAYVMEHNNEQAVSEKLYGLLEKRGQSFSRRLKNEKRCNRYLSGIGRRRGRRGGGVPRVEEAVQGGRRLG